MDKDKLIDILEGHGLETCQGGYDEIADAILDGGATPSVSVEEITNTVNHVLNHYKLAQTFIAGDDCLPLVDALCGPGATDISTGKLEIEYLGDAIATAIKQLIDSE